VDVAFVALLGVGIHEPTLLLTHLLVLLLQLHQLSLGLFLLQTLQRFLVEVVEDWVGLLEAFVGLGQLATLGHDGVDFVEVVAELVGSVGGVLPASGFVDDELEDAVVDDDLLVVLEVLLAEDGVDLGRGEVEEGQQLEPELFEAHGVGLEQVEVLADSRHDVLVLLHLVLVFLLDAGEHWSLHALDVLDRNEEPNLRVTLQLELARDLLFPLLALGGRRDLEVVDGFFFEEFVLEGVLDDLHLDVLHELLDAVDELVENEFGGELPLGGQVVEFGGLLHLLPQIEHHTHVHGFVLTLLLLVVQVQ
jgi:hypothetical protein